VLPGVEEERRRLAGMLPGAEIGFARGEFVALVRDVDLPIAVLVERGGYEYVPERVLPARPRVLRREPFRLVLADSREEFARLTAGG
jgi:hypothetical protein